MRRILLPLICLPALAHSTLAHSASLRSMTTLEAPMVRIADLFDDAGPGGARVLGPSPAPGNRIVVEAAQLGAIARQFGVDWRPSSVTDRVVLDRPGRPLPREAVFNALHDALSLLGAAADLDIEMPGFTAPLIPQEAEAHTSVDQLDYDAGSGRFTALLTVTADGMAVNRERVSGHISEMMDLPVLPHRVAVGAVIEAGDTRMTRVRADLVRGEVARVPEQMVGYTLRRSVPPGQPVALADLVRPSAIVKGARVVVELDAPGLTLVAQGVALENGALGERIAVLNPATRATLDAQVIGPMRVRVSPGSPSALPPRSALVATR